MATEDLIQTRLNEDSIDKSGLDHSGECWAPPLAPPEALGLGDMPLRQGTLGPAARDEHFVQPLEENYFAETEMSFGSRRKLIELVVGTTIVAALGVITLVYLWAPAGEKPTSQSAESPPAVQSSPEVLTRTDSTTPEPSRDPPAAVAWPDLPPSITVETSPDVAPDAPTANAASHQTASASQNQDIVFLQRPGVNIRSTPSTNGPVLGTVPKGTRLKVTNREGDWVQVESGRSSGWINSQFLAPHEPE
jgi:cytoskeletal protein RodZ